MCNHSHSSHCDKEHHHSHEGHNNSHSAVFRVVIALSVFIIALFFKNSFLLSVSLFILAYLIVAYDILWLSIKNILKKDFFDENFLMSIATIGAFCIGEYPEAVMVMLLYQVGEYWQHRAVEKSRKSVTDLMGIRPDYANLVRDNEIIKLSPKDVKVGDFIVVKTGEKIPLDGVVVDGKASVNMAALTGESVPKVLCIGDKAISGGINNDGYLKIRVEKLYKDSTVSRILDLVEYAASKKSKSEKFITKFAKIYTPAVVIGAVLLAIIPPLFFDGSFSLWLERALTFLVISCPCALVISVPLGFFAGIGKASKMGVLIKGSTYIEALANAKTIIFDKTGTLTKGSFSVTKISSIGISEDDLIAFVAKSEVYSNHPIANSIKAYYAKNIDESEISDVKEFSGKGIQSLVSGKTILVGNAKLLEQMNVHFEDVDENGSVVYVSIDGVYCGYIVVSDEIKEDSFSAISKLKKQVSNIVMLSGDVKETALAVSKSLGIKDVHYELLPEQKVSITERYIDNKSNKKSVVFVGDGINDAPVLTRADVGIAMGALGSDAAIEAADVVIMNDSPLKIFDALNISKKTISIVKQNIVFALFVKALFLILGAIGFMSLWGAVFSDVGVTLLAILNSLRLLK